MSTVKAWRDGKENERNGSSGRYGNSALKNGQETKIAHRRIAEETPRTMIKGFLGFQRNEPPPQHSPAIPLGQNAMLTPHLSRVSHQTVLSTSKPDLATPIVNRAAVKESSQRSDRIVPKAVRSVRRQARRVIEKETPRTLIRAMVGEPTKPQDMKFYEQTPSILQTKVVKPREKRETPRTFIRGFIDDAPPMIQSRYSIAANEAKVQEDTEQQTTVITIENSNGKLESSGIEDEEEESFFATKESVKASNEYLEKYGSTEEQTEDFGNDDFDLPFESDSDDDNDPLEQMEKNAKQFQRAARNYDEVPLVSISSLKTPKHVRSGYLSSSTGVMSNSALSKSSQSSAGDSLLSLSSDRRSISHSLATPISLEDSFGVCSKVQRKKRFSLSGLNETQIATPSILPKTTLLEGSELKIRESPEWQKKRPNSTEQLFDVVARHKRRQPMQLAGGRIADGRRNKNQLQSIQEEHSEDEESSEKETNPQMPQALVKKLWTNLLKTSQTGVTSCTKDCFQAIEQVTAKFFSQAAKDLSAFASHAGRQTINIADVQCLMHRQRVVSSERELQNKVRKLLPREYADTVVKALHKSSS